MALPLDLTRHLDDEPKAAATIAGKTGRRVDVVVWQLRQLEDAGVVEHQTDEMGVMRWAKARIEIKGRLL